MRYSKSWTTRNCEFLEKRLQLKFRQAGKRKRVVKDEPLPKALLDTNILVSAIISYGKARELLEKCINGRLSLVISEPILEELTTVMRRPKFKSNEEEVRRITRALLETTEMIAVSSDFNVVKDDPDDNMILNTAFDARADVIVTGDHHLLNLKSFK